MSRSFCEDYFRIVERFRERVALIDSFSGEEISYQRLNILIENFGDVLVKRGLKPGDLVASLLPGGLGSVITFLTSLRFGFDYLPLSSQSTGVELDRYLQLLKPSCLICLEEQADQDFLKIPRPSLPLFKVSGSYWKTLEAAAVVTPTNLKKSQARLFLATSGSTGRPKIIRLSGDRLWTAAVSFSSFHEFLDENTRFFNFYPMSYLAGLFNLTLIPMSVGASMVLGEGFSGLSLMKFWTTAKRFGVNVLWFSPTVLHGLSACNKKSFELCPPDLAREIRAGFLGMGAISLSQKKSYEDRLGFPLLENYGLSETTFISSETLSNRFRRVEGSIGEVLGWVETRINPETQELEVKTPCLAEAEIQDEAPGFREKLFDPQSFWPTGDIVEIVDRKLIYKTRLKNIVKKGGYLISLDEIERVLEKVKGISSVCAVGTEHPFYGESVGVCMLVAEKVASQDARKILAEQLARFKWPSFFFFVDSLPLTITGKPDRKRLEVLAAEALKQNQGEAF